MIRITDKAIGIDNGDAMLFSDFQDGGEMWTGTGPRERVTKVAFSEPFLIPPAVQVSLSLLDADRDHNLRTEVTAEAITETGCDVVFRTWGDSRIARVRISWLAIGPVADEDQWELY